jgi:hypothetical protein
MSPDVPPAPPEADVIRLAREAMDMTAQSAAEASRTHDGKGVSAAYWRDVERGAGGRRGERVAVRASARALAAMARVVGVEPLQLTWAGREDAARVLEEILRREEAARAAPQQLRPTGIRVIDEAAGKEKNLEPFIREIRQQIADAVAEYGPEVSGEEIFGPGYEANAWNSGQWSPDETVTMLALFRSFAARNVGGESGARTGLNRLRLLVGSP